ncbi:MAG: hypothetical protein M3Z75_09640 [Actinomycetota bacterium]|nr:hypothetical protein [Actinomycetota bacterium]
MEVPDVRSASGTDIAAVAAAAVMIGVSGHLRARRVLTWVPLLISTACFAVSCLTQGGAFTTSFILLVIAAASMYAPYGPYLAAIIKPHPVSRAAPGTGLINALGGLAGFVGTYIVGTLGGTFTMPYVFLAACLFVAALLMFAIRPPGLAAHPSPAAGRGDTDQDRETAGQ